MQFGGTTDLLTRQQTRVYSHTGSSVRLYLVTVVHANNVTMFTYLEGVLFRARLMGQPSLT